MLDSTDHTLLTAARDGDKNALETLLVRHQPRVYRFAMKMCGNPDDAADVLQETLLAMARGVRDLRGESSLSTWLYAVARSFCIKKRRSSHFAPKQMQSLDTCIAADDPHLADTRQSPEEDIAEQEIHAALTRAIAGLEPNYREVLILRDIEALSATEVAEVLGIRVDAVKSRLHRARLALRAAILPLLGIEADAATTAAPSTCPDVLTLFSRHLEGEISTDLCAKIELHLETCHHCRGACDSLKRTLSMCQHTPAQPVPQDVQNAVRHSLRRVLENHAD